MRVLLLLAVAVALSACSPPPPNSSGASNAAQPSRATDPHSPYIENDPYSTSIDVKTKTALRDTVELTQLYTLRGRVDRETGLTLALIQWSAVYTRRTWHFYFKASNDRGQSYDLREVNREVRACPDRCVYAETYNIFIPLADLQRGATDGIRFKIYARSGDSVIVELPASLIVQFNEKLAEAQKMRTKS